jgi:hypothetical protein
MIQPVQHHDDRGGFGDRPHEITMFPPGPMIHTARYDRSLTEGLGRITAD